MDGYLYVNSPNVVGELIDGEAILLNLQIGAYYSLNSSGSEIWALLEENGSPAIVIEAMRRRYPAAAEMAESVQAFLGSLVQENLLVRGDRAPSSGTPPVLPAPATYVAPSFTRHTDMQDLLLLDPLHEVDLGAGWPHPRPDA